MRKWLVCLIVFVALLAACAPSQTSTPTPEAQTGNDVTEEPAADVTEEATEVAADVTEEATEAVSEATEEATEVAADVTEEATEAVSEATEEATEAVSEATKEATEEATQEAEATAEAMELDATFTSEDGSISFMYPSGWFVSEETGEILLASSEDEASNTETPPSGAFRATILVSPITELDMGLSADATPLEVLQVVADAIAGADTAEATEEAGDATEEAGDAEDIFAFEEPEEMTVGTHDAASLTGKRGDSDVVVWVIRLDDNVYAAIIAATASSELADLEPTLAAVAETITYTPMDAAVTEATEEATEQAGG
jgi:hypothetical protein